MLKACINGSRRLEEHDRLPISAHEIAADVERVTAAGADAVHLHVRDAAGVDTLDGQALERVLRAVRAAAPGVPVGVTTGAWAVPDPVERRAMIASWTAVPDFASVNWHEDGADEVAETLLAKGVAIEAGLWHATAVRLWSTSRVRKRCLRVLLELPDGPDESATEQRADRLLSDLAAVDNDLPTLLHGQGTSCWPALCHATRRGLDARIGLEDVLTLPDGTAATDNASLVNAARGLIASAVQPHHG